MKGELSAPPVRLSAGDEGDGREQADRRVARVAPESASGGGGEGRRDASGIGTCSQWGGAIPGRGLA